MKKRYYIQMIAGIALLLGACNYNDRNFEDLDELVRPTNVFSKSDTLTTEDYGTISDLGLKLAKTKEDSALIKAIKTNHYLTDQTPGSKFIPAFLAQKWFSASESSAVNMTYNKGVDIPDYILKMSDDANSYALTAEDYLVVWKKEKINYLSAEKNPEVYLPKILAERFTQAKDGDLKYVAYKYLEGNVVPEPTLLEENFESGTDKEVVSLEGWTNYKEKGKSAWVFKSYGGNRYAEFSSYKTEEDNIVWLISPALKINDLTKPEFTFDITIRNYVGHCLSVLVSGNYDGTHPENADWKDITGQFCVDYVNGDFIPAGIADLTAYKEGSVHIAFCYYGSDATDPKKTTTCRIDNVLVKDGIEEVEFNEVYAENFNGVTNKQPVTLEGWKNIAVKGDAAKYSWIGSVYNNDGYVKISANNAPGEVEGWLVSPEYDLTGKKEVYFSFDLKIGYFNHDCLEVLIAEDYDGTEAGLATAKWLDVTDKLVLPQEPSSGFTQDWTPAGVVSLASYSGKKIRIALKYTGDGTKAQTTTYQIDHFSLYNIVKNVVSGAVDKYQIYGSESGTWKLREDAVVVNPSDYETMGIAGNCFNETARPENYLLPFLKQVFPYAQEGVKKVVVYDYDDGKKVGRGANEFTYTDNAWIQNHNIEVVTEQYLLNKGTWMYDPDVTVTLEAGQKKGNGHFQAICDYVWEQIDQAAGVSEKGKGYLTSFGNNEYYYGASEYQNNFDFRTSAWKKQTKAYDNMSDEELTALMWKRLPEAVMHMFERKYPLAKPVEGLDVIYTANFVVYDGSESEQYTIQFKVTGPAQFTYVEDSLKKIEE